MTKKELLESGETLEVDYAGAYTAFASRNEPEWDGEKVTGGDWGISYHKGEMPATNTENFSTVDELLAKMKSIALLTQWRISHP